MQHNRDVAQVLVRWSLQKGYTISHAPPFLTLIVIPFSRFVPLPKSAQPSRISSNVDVFNFELSAEDMQELDGLDSGKAGSVTWNPVDAP